VEERRREKWTGIGCCWCVGKKRIQEGERVWVVCVKREKGEMEGIGWSKTGTGREGRRERKGERRKEMEGKEERGIRKKREKRKKMSGEGERGIRISEKEKMKDMRRLIYFNLV
jgi:hypothetical protein